LETAFDASFKLMVNRYAKNTKNCMVLRKYISGVRCWWWRARKI